ncbi:hypothetical protein BGZ80_002240 [Entomortierella chlamydospora]|uniref:GRAM domain-containing protein n=1 Tax=Entomortierella chlamydospora TaxID=101097 RepID=A0A9P6MQI3_9FUNG|nr:hypothetical protein BGZ80_002240 [Entomortierella chlamydospora]
MSNPDYNSIPELPPPLPARRPTVPTVTEDAKPYYLASRPSAEENNEIEDLNSPPPLPAGQRIPTIVTPQTDTETAGSPAQKMPSYPDGSLSPKSKSIAPSTSGLTTATAHTAHTALSGKTEEEVTFEFDRHVQEIRRRRTVARRPPPPDKDDYTRIEDESGKRVLDVGLYIQANVTYFIESLARDDKVKKIEPLQWKRMRGLLSRLYDTSNPVQSLGLYVERVMLWKNPPETFIWFTVYFTLWLYKLWLPAFISLFVIKILNNRYGFLGDFKEKLNVPASLSDRLNVANDNDVKRKSKIHSQLRDLIHSKDLTDWISQMTKIWGPYCQALLEENVNYLERVKNLFRWERPEQTWRVVALLSFYIFVSTFFQFLVLPAIGYAIGVEYFILLPMQHYYPRYSHLFSPVEWILWGVPTNAELAVEMLTRQREGAEGIDDTFEPTAHEEEVEQDSASVAGLSPASKIKHEYQKRIRGMSLSGTSVMSESSSADNADSSAQDKNEFHCTMRGKPGKLVITEEAIMFRSARLLGRETEVQISWGDIDSVKKSRTMNVGLWSMPGIDVTDIDGKVTVFQNVVKRDEAFRKMVLTSGKKWSSVA